MNRRPASETDTIGSRIRAAMRAAGVPQHRLAEMIGSQQPSISRYCTGGATPSMATLRKIAEALGVADWRELLPE